MTAVAELHKHLEGLAKRPRGLVELDVLGQQLGAPEVVERVGGAIEIGFVAAEEWPECERRERSSEGVGVTRLLGAFPRGRAELGREVTLTERQESRCLQCLRSNSVAHVSGSQRPREPATTLGEVSLRLPDVEESRG